jgi:hypothetical protein
VNCRLDAMLTCIPLQMESLRANVSSLENLNDSELEENKRLVTFRFFLEETLETEV